MGKGIFDFIAPILGGALGSVVPGVGTALGAAIGSGLNTGVSTGNPLAGALSFGGSLAGGGIGQGLSIGTDGILGQSLGSFAGNALGDLGGTTLGSALGSTVGSSLGGSLGSAITGGNGNVMNNTAWNPVASPAVGLPQSLSQFGNLNPQQQASNIATRGVFGSGNGPDEQNYFLNLMNRQLFDNGGNQVSNLNNVSPVDMTYLNQLGISGSTPGDILQGIHSYAG